MKKIFFVCVIILISVNFCIAKEPTKESESVYNKDIFKALTSKDLTKADLAWHAYNTYGWECEEVVSVGPPQAGGFYYITCISGEKFRVYPRKGQYPQIKNAQGNYK